MKTFFFKNKLFDLGLGCSNRQALDIFKIYALSIL